jgi:iron complex outermembrane receptor protein
MARPLSRNALAAFLALGACAAAPVMAAAPSLEGEAGAEEHRGESAGDADSDEATWTGATVQVTARGTAADWPSALATEVVGYEEAIAAPEDFQDLITRVPGVGATGQNGLFETFSIRGSGANGILILVGGMPVTAQRRAGVPVAFVEPALLGDIAVPRGPAVVHYGRGALGGALSISPRWFDTTTASAGYATSGDETSLTAATGSDTYSIAVARHQAGDSEAPNGVPLNTSFRRESASLQYRTQFGDFALDALLLPSRTEDIGKSNSRYPTRDTTYPEDSHTLGRLRLRHAGGFEASVHAHEQYLGTWNQRPDRADTFAAVSSTDIGATVQQTIETGALTTNFGWEYLGRRDVTAYDADGSVTNRTYSLDGASEDGWSLFALADWRLAPAFALEFGARHSAIEQEEDGARLDDADNAFTAGAVWTPTDASRVTLNVSTGYRFPTLEERFYSGVTAVGEVVGNPDLGSEHSEGIDLGYAWRAGDWSSEIHVWRTDIDDLIQLVDLAPDVNGYINVGEARLHGAEASIAWTPVDGLLLRTGAAVVRGTDLNRHEPLYGIPPVTTEFEAVYTRGKASLGARYSHRWAMDRPGFEELERDAVDVVDADLRYRLRPDLGLQFYVRNLFDETYYATADELSTFAQERSVGVNLSWTR